MTTEFKSSEVDVLIIGGGFAGLSVASKLQGTNVLTIDRGSRFDPSASRRHLTYPQYGGAIGDFAPLVEAEARIMQSDVLRDRVDLPLSVMSANVYSYRQGGISNWWGGYCKRITKQCFAQDGIIAWPDEVGTLDYYYAQAEHLLRVHGDPVRSDATVYAAMPGWDIWRSYLAPVFPGAHVTSEAKNVTDRSGDVQIGLCTGNGHCAICANDAKARPATTFPSPTIVGNTVAKQLLFSGSRAIGLRCEADNEEFDVHADRIVLAAGGLENVALLRRSQLPSASPAERIGLHYQDHTAAELIVRMPSSVPYFQIGAECHAELPDVSGVYRGLELKCLFLSIPPDRHILSKRDGWGTVVDVINGMSDSDRLGRIYLQIEVPPEWNLRVRTRHHQSYLYTMPYYERVPLLDAVVLDVIQRISAKGIQIVDVEPHYRSSFGGHHYSGVTPMSKGERSVVDADHLLHGTDNVYISGASVMPRCGSAGPTLSIVAMGLRLGEILSHGVAQHL